MSHHPEVLCTLVRHADFQSEFVTLRHVDVWLPPGYVNNKHARYPVLYMHDGQNLFDPTISYGGVDWGIDEALIRLIEEKRVPEIIVVGMWNTDRRWREYMPQKPLDTPAAAIIKAQFIQEQGGDLFADRYLRFIVEEVKPFIDATYKTLPQQEKTFVMGSSMGGLISLYALCEYPHVFAGAGCISTHWPAGDGIVVDYLAEMLPKPGAHKLYFDYGTETLDAQYEGYQQRVDAILREVGYREGSNWITRKFVGAEHSERSWRTRVHIPLEFLLGS
ncbi:MAG: alpha/beta hydrolase [Anaerolineae bacterium]|nr:alpha/beta hydrolase [Anaerolineae bacterium]